MPKPKSSVQDETPSQEDSATSKRSQSSPKKVTNEAKAAVTPDQVEVIENSYLDEDEKTGENGDIAAEKEPLRPSEERPSTSAAADTLVGDEEDAISKDDLDSDDVAIRKKGWDVRCVIIGLLVLILMVGGATAAILVHRFKGKTTYDFRYAMYYGNHMVLQRAPNRASVWGYGPVLDDNTTVRLTVLGEGYEKEYSTVVRNTLSGQTWKVVLDEMTAAGPFKLTAELVGHEGHVVSIDDVLFGDVWVCAGEENMRDSLDKLDNAAEEIQSADQFPSIRIFSVFPAKSDRLWYDLRGIEIEWSLPSNVSLAGTHQLFSPRFSSLCWLYGRQLHQKLGHPVGLIVSAYEDSMLQDWASSTVAKTCKVPFSYNTARIWNAMVNPLLDLSIYGLILYQGETDAKEMSLNYNCTLVEMLKEWRTEMYARTLAATDPHFPVGIVQLAPNRPGNHLTFGFTGIRWKQTANYGFAPNAHLKNTFLAVTLDLPGGNETHFEMRTPHKQVIADRLILGALAVGYNRSTVQHQGPFPVRYQVKKRDTSFVLYFANQDIDVRTDAGFEVCCSENKTLNCPPSSIEATFAPGRKWESASIKGQSSRSITLDLRHCPSNKHIVGLRYAWRETPCRLKQCAVYGSSSGLPMPPYIQKDLTDDGKIHDLSAKQVNIL
ncbi:hypothetical protein CAPTEDRAFT_219955 [Capitella teleta]|uniref:Sialate O-acetylesterase domain-containing protein n=1 Tax=Capitella teleta TaxID=283909 RepID=R7T6D6_CAPTE|nr:hypothetical protein CAPTEDRAFT_219955 [Capitella teleta]|eukprot:ELT89020.1 hypothetical protein CAPTEDRAFT_219955 [Capitella teleta]